MSSLPDPTVAGPHSHDTDLSDRERQYISTGFAQAVVREYCARGTDESCYAEARQAAMNEAHELAYQLAADSGVKVTRPGITGMPVWYAPAVAKAVRDLRANRTSVLPDPTVTGPCQAQATFMCTGEAQGEHLNPLAMLPGSKVRGDYVPMCLVCKDHLSDAYVTAVHSLDPYFTQPHTTGGN